MHRFINKNVLEEEKDQKKIEAEPVLKPTPKEEEYRKFLYMNRMYGMGGFERIKSVKENFNAIINNFTTPGYLYFLNVMQFGFNLKEKDYNRLLGME